MVTTYLKPKDLSILYTDLTFIPGKVCRVFLDSLLQHNPPDSHTQNSVRHPMCLVGSHADIAQGHPKGLAANSASHHNSILPHNFVSPTLAQADSLDWESQILMEQEQKRMQTATKSDDAEVPEHLWDSRILPHLLQGERTKILKPIRTLALRWWRRNLLRDFLKWFKKEHKSCVVSNQVAVIHIKKNGEAMLDWTAGRDCIWRAAEASWWDWTKGSRPFHWRWPIEYRTVIRDGVPLWFISPPPTTKIPQRGEPDPVKREIIRTKLSTV
jgi:hypothetical protein